MKSSLLLIFICLQTLAFGQITLEELSSPDDFNVAAIRKSPLGEYFTQAYNDTESIYTSMNGVDWTKSPLPERHSLDDIQYFSDGTPVLKSERDEHLIRRNGIWYTMNISGGWPPIEASFIKEDSLFAYQNSTFAYSLDKGQTFTIVCTYSGSIVDHTANLWKFENHFVLHHTAGASDVLSIFNENGDQIFNEGLNLGIPTITYNECGEVLFVDNNNYYLLKEQGLSFQQGNVESIISNFSYSTDLFSQGGNYYLREGNTIFKTTGCDFNWESWISHDLIESKEKIWINPQEDIYLLDRQSDRFIEQLSGTNVWEDHLLDIDYAFVYDIDESFFEHQATLSSNALFIKNINDAEWVEFDSSGRFTYQVQYSPDGDLYVNRNNNILYSADNGNTFNSIELPDNGFPNTTYRMEVLDDDIIFIIDGLFGDSYYTLNNGQDWIETVSNFYIELPLVKLVDNHILIAELEYDYVVIKIDIATNEFTFEELGDFYNFSFYGSTIQDDGTIYFQGQDIDNINPEGLYRYRYGEALEFIGQFQELGWVNSFHSSGTDLYAFGQDEYYLFDGENLTTYPLTGLPGNSYSNFIIAENEYLYAIANNHRIFKSTGPLSFPQFITGTIYNNLNQDCVPDISDPALKYWQVKVESDDYFRIKTTNNAGSFSFSVPEGDYTLSSQAINTNWDLCEPSFAITIDENDSNVNQDFQAKGLVDCAELEIDFSTPFLRRCFDNYYSVQVRNTGPQPSAGTILTMELDPFFDFISASIPYTQVEDSIIEFDLGVLAVNDQISFQIYFNISCDAELGMEHCLAGILSDDNICSGARSDYKECQENIGAYDPNDKRIFNENGAEAETVDKGEYIYYHIRFQNTGTDTAFNIKVVDALSPILDLNTLEMLSASHPYDFTITDGPTLEVNFESILLPDSTTNEPASHGYFKFRIKPLPEFDYGTSIPNQAAIYFDFNDPILTNEAILVIQLPVGIKEPGYLVDFNVFPNPVTDLLTLTISADDLNRIDRYEMVNQLGQLIRQSTILQNEVINVADLTPGIYYLILKENGANIGRVKFVKM